MKKGFTLVEILVVVLIIGLLIAIAVPQYMRSVERSRAVEAFSTLRPVADAAVRTAKMHSTVTWDNIDIKLEGTRQNASIATKNFTFTINNAPLSITAKRNDRGYSFLQNIVDGGLEPLVCISTDAAGTAACQNLGFIKTADGVTGGWLRP